MPRTFRASGLVGAMKAPQNEIETLEDLYSSEGFQVFQESIYGNDGWINDPERRERIEEAAEDGSDGSTHAEVIQDWRDFLDTLETIDPEFPEDGGEITEGTYAAIEAEIDACEKWHEENGSLDRCSG